MKPAFFLFAWLGCLSATGLAQVNATNCSPIFPGLVSWWAANGTATDSIGANHGTLFGGINFTNGRSGQAFNFDGIDDAISIADSPSLQLTQSFTIEAWIYIREYPVEPYAFWKHGAIIFRGDDRGGLDPYSLMVAGDTRNLELSVVSADNQQAFLQAPIAAREWIHVAGTLDDATGAMKLYLNGAVVAQTNTPLRSLGPLDPGANPGVGIGNVQGISSSPFRFAFNGLIDNLRLYSRALSQTEIQSIYNPGPCPISLDLAMYAGLTLSAPVGSMVRIDYRTALSPLNEWRLLTNVVVPTSPYIFLDRASTPVPQRFYRAFLLP